MAKFPYTWGLRTPLLLIALCAASSTTFADPAVAVAEASVAQLPPAPPTAVAVGGAESKPVAPSPAEAAAVGPKVHGGIDVLAGGAGTQTGEPCAQGAGLDTFAGKLNGTYDTRGKDDSVTPLAFPDAPQAGTTLDAWLRTLNAELLGALNLRFDDAQRAQYRGLEAQRCSTIYCQVAMRQKTIYYLLGGQ